MRSARLILSGYCDAATNMAIDEAIFSSYQEGSCVPTLRLYGWRPAAISLGYSQDAQGLLDIDACRKEGIDIVRRLTGGGIIFHDAELTYSLVLAQADIGQGLGVKGSFEAITSFLLLAYQDLGMPAAFAKDTDKKPAANHSIAGFCFARNEEYDILACGKKLGGNAQKRRRNMILQHGSIPFSFNAEKAGRFLKNRAMLKNLNNTCMNEATKERMDFDKLSDALIKAFSSKFDVTLKNGGLTDEETDLANRLKTSKYSVKEWNIHATCATAGMA